MIMNLLPTLRQNMLVIPLLFPLKMGWSRGRLQFKRGRMMRTSARCIHTSRRLPQVTSRHQLSRHVHFGFSRHPCTDNSRGYFQAKIRSIQDEDRMYDRPQGVSEQEPGVSGLMIGCPNICPEYPGFTVLCHLILGQWAVYCIRPIRVASRGICTPLTLYIQ